MQGGAFKFNVDDRRMEALHAAPHDGCARPQPPETLIRNIISSGTQGYELFGFTRDGGATVYREWAPAAQGAQLIGDFNGWQGTPLERDDFGVWSVRLPDGADADAYNRDDPGRVCTDAAAPLTTLGITAGQLLAHTWVEQPVQGRAGQLRSAGAAIDRPPPPLLPAAC